MTHDPIKIFQKEPKNPAKTISEIGPEVVNGLGDTGLEVAVPDAGEAQLNEILARIPTVGAEFDAHINKGLARGDWRAVGVVAMRHGIPGEPLIGPRYTSKK